MRTIVVDDMRIGLRRVERNVYTVVYHLGTEEEAAIGSLYQGNSDPWRAMHTESGVSFGGQSQAQAAGRMVIYHRQRLATAEQRAAAEPPPPPAGQLSMF